MSKIASPCYLLRKEVTLLPMLVFWCFCCSYALHSAQSKQHEGQPRTPEPGVTVTSADILAKWQSLAKWVDVRNDPVYESPKRFKAIPLTALLTTIGCSNPNSEVHISCKDGYVANLSGTEALDGSGFLAFADEMFPERPGFSPLKTKSGLVDPGPLYLFWDRDSRNRPRPYQIEQIELCSANDTLARARPSGDAKAQRGFEVFKRNCSPCHAVNGAGGRVGIDLNIPMNVTEYWKKTALKQLLIDPSLVRANTKMPPLHLTPAQVDEVIAYLQDMRDRKMTN
jgi:mono/diheme cytochrome c family protein